MAMKRHSWEHRAKIAAALKGRKQTSEHKAKIAAAKSGQKRICKIGDIAATVPVAPLIEIIERRVRGLKPSGEMGVYAPHRSDEGVDVWASLGISYRCYRLLLQVDAISVYRADRIACAMGLHPIAIWTDFDRVDAA